MLESGQFDIVLSEKEYQRVKDECEEAKLQLSQQKQQLDEQSQIIKKNTEEINKFQKNGEQFKVELDESKLQNNKLKEDKKEYQIQSLRLIQQKTQLCDQLQSKENELNESQMKIAQEFEKLNISFRNEENVQKKQIQDLKKIFQSKIEQLSQEKKEELLIEATQKMETLIQEKENEFSEKQLEFEKQAELLRKEIEYLEDSMKQLKQDHKTQLDDLEIQILEQREQQEKQKLTFLDDQKRLLQSNTERWDKEKQTLEIQIKELQKFIQELTNEDQDNNNKDQQLVKELKVDIINLQKIIQQANLEKEQLQQEHQDELQILTFQREDSKEMSQKNQQDCFKQIESLSNTNEQLQKKLKHSQDNLKSMEKQVKEYSKRIKAMEQNQRVENDLKQIIAHLNQDKSKFEKTMNTQQEVIEENKDILEQLHLELEKQNKNKQIQDHENKIKIDVLQEENQQLLEKMNQDQFDFEKKIKVILEKEKQMEKEIVDQGVQIINLQDNIKIAEKNNSDKAIYDKEIEQYKQNENVLQQQIQILGEKCQEIVVINENKEKKINSFQENEILLQQKVEELEKIIENKALLQNDKNNEQYQQNQGILEEKIQQYEENIQKMQVENEKVISIMQAMDDENSKLKKQLSEFSMNPSSMTSSQFDLNASVSIRSNDIQIVRESLAKQKLMNKNLVEANLKLKKSFEQVEQEKIALVQVHTKLQEEQQNQLMVSKVSMQENDYDKNQIKRLQAIVQQYEDSIQKEGYNLYMNYLYMQIQQKSIKQDQIQVEVKQQLKRLKQLINQNLGINV